MLRRTKGRLLLTLLVVTGMAGTVHDSSLSKKERKTAISLMRETKTGFIKSVKDLSPSQLNFKPSPDQPSVKETIYHIASSEYSFWSLLQKSMKSPANPEMHREIKITDDELVKMIESADYNIEVFNLAPVKKLSGKNTGEVLSDFKDKRTAHIKYINTSTEDLRNHVVKLPLGWVDCYQLCLIMAAHSNRHIQAINELKAETGFPEE